jgi:EmrB/QacA subfamily drug resistance transporter
MLAPFAAIVLVLLLSSLDQTVVATALPVIARDLGDPSRLPWVVTSYLAAATVALPIYGKMGDQFGRKTVLLVALALFLVGSALCGMADTLGQLIFYRALQGFGGGGLVVSAFATVGDLVAPERRARIQGWLGAVFAVSTIAGPLIGGALAEHADWRWIFYVNLPLGGLALLLIAATFPQPARTGAGSIDTLGIALLSIALAGLVLGSQLAAEPGRGVAPPVLLALGFAATAAIAFVLVELRAAEPVIPIRSMLGRSLGGPALVSFVSGVPLFGVTTFAPVYWQSVRDFSPTEAGLATLPLLGGTLLASILTGEVSTRLHRFSIFPIAGSVLSLAGLILLAASVRSPSDLPIYVALGLTGIGFGMSLQTLLAMAQAGAARRDLGTVTGTITTVRPLGGLLGLALVGGLYAARLGAAPEGALAAVFWASAAGALLQVLASLLLAEPVISKSEKKESMA